MLLVIKISTSGLGMRQRIIGYFDYMWNLNEIVKKRSRESLRNLQFPEKEYEPAI